MFLTTALFNQLASDAPGAFSDLRHLLFGGETVEPKWVAQVLEQRSTERLLHVYGSTETTTFATWRQVIVCRREPRLCPSAVPLPTRKLMLDEHLRPVPIGVHGELYIGGDGVRLGYLRRPELTVEICPKSFPPNPGGMHTRQATLSVICRMGTSSL
jgi:non-ribosomal peptide synthetase component F